MCLFLYKGVINSKSAQISGLDHILYRLNKMQVLSKKGVLFLTGGFNQTYIFQNITHILDYEHDSKLLAILKTILSDGEIYISAVYYIKSLG